MTKLRKYNFAQSIEKCRKQYTGVHNSPKKLTYTKKVDFNALDILRRHLIKLQSSDLTFIGVNN